MSIAEQDRQLVSSLVLSDKQRLFEVQSALKANTLAAAEAFVAVVLQDLQDEQHRLLLKADLEQVIAELDLEFQHAITTLLGLEALGCIYDQLRDDSPTQTDGIGSVDTVEHR